MVAGIRTSARCTCCSPCCASLNCWRRACCRSGALPTPRWPATRRPSSATTDARSWLLPELERHQGIGEFVLEHQRPPCPGVEPPAPEHVRKCGSGPDDDQGTY